MPFLLTFILEKVINTLDVGYNPEKTIIKDITINAKAGQTIAIVGPTGAGKTTIINLLIRFYDSQKGEILMDKLPSLKIKRKDLLCYCT